MRFGSGFARKTARWDGRAATSHAKLVAGRAGCQGTSVGADRLERATPPRSRIMVARSRREKRGTGISRLRASRDTNANRKRCWLGDGWRRRDNRLAVIEKESPQKTKRLGSRAIRAVGEFRREATTNVAARVRRCGAERSRESFVRTELPREPSDRRTIACSTFR